MGLISHGGGVVVDHSGGGGAVSSVSNVDGSLTISPTTGDIVASINLSHVNTWAVGQSFDGGITSIGGSTGVAISATLGAITFTSIGNANNEGIRFVLTGSDTIQMDSPTGAIVWQFFNSNFAIRPNGQNNAMLTLLHTGSSANVRGVAVISTATSSTASNPAESIVGTSIRSSTTGGIAGTISGIRGIGQYSSTGTQVDAYGVYGIVQKITSASGVITDAYSIYGDPPTAAGGGTITNSWAGGFIGNVKITGTILNSSLTASKPIFSDANKNLISGSFSIPQIVASANLLAQSATVSSVATYTTPNDGTVHSFRTGAYTTITAISAGTLTITVTFTDQNNAAQTVTYFPMGLTSAGLTTTGFTAFESANIRCKDNTAITVVATFTGVSITYDVGATIESLY